jgi:hypothetical protein
VSKDRFLKYLLIKKKRKQESGIAPVPASLITFLVIPGIFTFYIEVRFLMPAEVEHIGQVLHSLFQ